MSYAKIGGSDVQWERDIGWFIDIFFLTGKDSCSREVILHDYTLSLAGHIRLHLTVDTVHDRPRYSTFPTYGRTFHRASIQHPYETLGHITSLHPVLISYKRVLKPLQTSCRTSMEV